MPVVSGVFVLDDEDDEELPPQDGLEEDDCSNVSGTPLLFLSTINFRKPENTVKAEPLSNTTINCLNSDTIDTRCEVTV